MTPGKPAEKMATLEDAWKKYQEAYAVYVEDEHAHDEAKAEETRTDIKRRNSQAVLKKAETDFLTKMGITKAAEPKWREA